MTSWFDPLPAGAARDELVGRVEASPRVLAVILTGSWARDMATEDSDVDLFLIVERGDLGWGRERRDGFDIQTVTLDRLRAIPHDPARWWDRYSYCRTRVLLDRSDGAVPRLLEAWATLDPGEIAAAIDFHIEGYLNYLYRSLKDDRDGYRTAARLDAAESLPWALALAFAVHGRVRPSNKYLEWELVEHPFEGEGWAAAPLLATLDDILDKGCVDAQRRLFCLIDAKARGHGFGGVIDTFDGIGLIRAA